MARSCDSNAATGFRLWPLVSAATFRRKLLEALTCGCGSRQSAKQQAAPEPKVRSDRLSELLTVDTSESGFDEIEAAESRRKAEALEEFQATVQCLHSGGDRRREAAQKIRRLAKDDAEARESLAMLGGIPPLISMLDPELDLESQIEALYALLNLGIGNDMNKAAIVKAGAVHKMLGLIGPCLSPSLSEAIVANLLSLSALDSNKLIIGSSGAIPFLLNSFQNANSRLDALRALFNLSIAAPNSPCLIESGLVPTLLSAIGDMEVTERALATLSNLIAASPEARRAVNKTKDSFAILIDVLNWSDSPECQEKSAYVLMVMAHKSSADRTAMAEAGIASALLELTLLGSALAQKRASRILEILRVGKGKEISESVMAVSAPMVMDEEMRKGKEKEKGKEREKEREGEIDMSEEKWAVKQLVQQSLQSNMRRIARRANLPQDFVPSEQLKALSVSSTSKSLPL